MVIPGLALSATQLRRHKMWLYGLTPEEEATCVRVGYQRQEPFLAKPERNINYSEGDLWEMWQHVVCAGSELALARMLGNYDFIPHVNTFKSRQDIDNVCEVRYSFKPDRGLRITNRDDFDSIYVLLVDGLQHKIRRQAPDYRSMPYVAMGWIYGSDALRDGWKYNETTWYVPIGELNRMEILPRG